MGYTTWNVSRYSNIRAIIKGVAMLLIFLVALLIHLHTCFAGRVNTIQHGTDVTWLPAAAAWF